MTTLTGAFLGHVLAGFIGGGVNFFLGYWMATRIFKRELDRIEREQQRHLTALCATLTADQFVAYLGRLSEPPSAG